MAAWKETSPNDWDRLTIVTVPNEWRDYDPKKDSTGRILGTELERLVKRIDEVSFQKEVKDESSMGSYNFDTVVPAPTVQTDDAMVALDLEFLRPQQQKQNDDDETTDKNRQPVRIRLNRDASEPSHRAFQRLELSVAKKLLPKKKKKKKPPKKRKQGTASSEEASTLRILAGSETLDPTAFSAMELCQQLVSRSKDSSHLGMDLSIPREEDDDETSLQREDSIPNTTLRFVVEANPPVVLATETFESFGSRLYVGNPVVVQTTLLHATRANVFWFVGEERVPSRRGHVFVPEACHVGQSLTVVIVPVRETKDAPIRCGRPEAYRFEHAIEALPPLPIVRPLRQEFLTSKPSEALRVCTYNVLADLYCFRDGTSSYPHTRTEFLDKTRRYPLLVAELASYHADLLCLQEVDGSAYETYLEPTLKALGYEGAYANKAKATTREGCALFWKTSSFELDRSWTIDIRELFGNDSSSESDAGAWESSTSGIHRLLEAHPELKTIVTEHCGQVLQVARLIPRGGPNTSQQPGAVVIANTHLFWHPMADHVRAMQVHAVLKKLDELRRCRTPNKPDPFILCGDLNSDPNSGAYRLLATRRLEANDAECWKNLHRYRWKVDEREVETLVQSGVTANERRRAASERSPDPTEASLVAPPALVIPATVPDLVSGCVPTPEFTNFAPTFAETLDYVLASRPSEETPHGLAPVASAPMPSRDDVEALVAMPNEFMPSDHVSIVCDLEWCHWED